MCALGSPAITPHLNLGVGEGSLPTFTTEDATAWASAHPPFRMVPLTPYTVSSVRFMTSGELSAMLSAFIGLHDAAPICYVELDGVFAGGAPRGVSNRLTRVFEVFDGRSGNFIMAGGQRNRE